MREDSRNYPRRSLTCEPGSVIAKGVSRRGWIHFPCGGVSVRRLCVVAFIALALPCLAQDVSTGAIRGVVLDPSNSRIRAASVVLINDATGLRYEHLSDGAGRFAFELLPPGDYSARVTAQGMSPQVSPGLHVTLGAETEIEFKLSIAGVQETVTVSAEAKQVETEPR